MNDLVLISTEMYQLRIDQAGIFYRYDMITESKMTLTDLQAKGMMLVRLDNINSEKGESKNIVRKSNGIRYANINYNKQSEISKEEANDCVVRAIAASLEISYDEAHSFTKEKFGRVNRKGTINVYGVLKNIGDVDGKVFSQIGLECPTEGYVDRDSRSRFFSYSGKKMIWSYKVKGEQKWATYTIGKFLKEYSKGTYFIIVKGHALTIKDGVVYGNHSDATSLKVRVERAFEVLDTVKQ